MATRKIKDAKDLSTNELIYFKGHAKATYMSDGSTVEDAINSIQTGSGGGIVSETDPVFSASAAASITEAKKAEWDNKVDKVSGKQLTTEDFTTILKTKLEGLSNYDDTELVNALSTLRGDFDALVSGDTTTAIKSFNEVIAFLDGIQDTQDLSSIIASIQQQIAGKMDKITLAKVATSGSYNDLSNKPTIPSAVTESTVSGWGFTKNTGTYSKPSTGIPKTDLASAVQTSLEKADAALQSYTEQYKGTVTKVKINGSEKSPDSNGLVDLGTIESGAASSTGNYPVIELYDYTEVVLSPNIYYIDIIEGIGAYQFDVTLNQEAEISGQINEYIVEVNMVNFLGGSISCSFPEEIIWANGNVPLFEAGHTYVISIVNNLAVFAEF